MSASFAPATHGESIGRRPSDPVADFIDARLAALEGRLLEDCSRLGSGLGRLGDSLACAVGTQGTGGSRWRPLLTMAAAEAAGEASDAALEAAVAVELTHTASLVLDDLPCMDDSDIRRGQPATHRLTGSAGAILLAVGLMARAVELLAAVPRCGAALSREWGECVGLEGMAGGQAMDVAGGAALRGRARRLYREKSTALPAFALSAGAHVGGAPAATRARLVAFGRSLGWAYQLLDDVEDLEEDRERGHVQDGPPPQVESRRIMGRAYRQLGEIPGLRPDGVEVLRGIASHVVGPESAATGDSARRGGW